MIIRTIFAEIIAIMLLMGAAGTIQAGNRSAQKAKTPAASVSQCNAQIAAPSGKSAAAAPVRESMDRDFIDTGVMEGTDMLEGDLEIGGLLTDDTLTKVGHQLFDVFNRAWKPVEGASYNIVFNEFFDPIRGSLITVRLNDTVIFEGFLTPREDAINELGKGLARDIRNLVRNTATLEEEEFY